MRSIIKAALLAWIVSRAIFFILTILISQMAFQSKTSDVWITQVDLSRERLVPELTRIVMVGDPWWYRSIARDGYERRPFDTTRQSNWAFFPMYPLTVRVLGMTGNFGVDGLLVSNAAFLGALLLLGAVARLTGSSEEDSERAIFYLALFPTSYFFSLPISESLFLLFSLAAFYAAYRRRWWVAGGAGALASLTRVTGVFLLLPLLMIAWPERKVARWRLLWLGLLPCAIAGHMVYLKRITGNALAFRDIQQTWDRSPSPFWQPLLEYLHSPATVSYPWNFIAFNFAIAMLLFSAAAAMAWRRNWPLAVHTLIMALLPLSTGQLMSISRYALAAFPLFLWLGSLGRFPRLDRVLTATSAALLGWFIALYALHIGFTIA